MFEDIFGFRSATFIAPCYIWSDELNQTLFDHGVKAFQGSWYQFEPTINRQKGMTKRFHYTGQKISLVNIIWLEMQHLSPQSLNMKIGLRKLFLN